MRLSDFKYDLPASLIAQHPLPNRDQSNLLILNRSTRRIAGGKFCEIIDYLRPGDALVLNDTKVFPARLHGRKDHSDAQIEVFLLRELRDSHWEVLVKPARKIRTGHVIHFNDDVRGEVVDVTDRGGRVVRFNCNGNFHDIIESFGETPLPPYIKRPPLPSDRERYQTVYARVPGAVAAPTAGLHFTAELLNLIRAKGVEIIPITLHVGLGTFRPVGSEDISRHQMDSEFYEILPEAAEAINGVIHDGGRIFSVGTTCTRALESAAICAGRIKPESGWTNKFIYPPYDFQIVDGLITNFHLPCSTLLMLVAAFADYELIMKAYQYAIRKKYRFYSYGDAMLII